MSDTIGNMLSQIKNAYLVGKESVVLANTKLGKEVAEVLKKHRFLDEVKVEKEKLFLTLKYEGNNPALTQIKRVSKPGLRVYQKKKEIRLVNAGLGICVISTPQGIMDGRAARKKNLGGEIICEVW